jgi:hypothetical protein
MFITSFEEQNITYSSCSNFRIHLCCDALMLVWSNSAFTRVEQAVSRGLAINNMSLLNTRCDTAHVSVHYVPVPSP